MYFDSVFHGENSSTRKQGSFFPLSQACNLNFFSFFLESFKAFWHGMGNVTRWAMEQLLWKPQHDFPGYCGFVNSMRTVALLCYFNVHFLYFFWEKEKAVETKRDFWTYILWTTGCNKVCSEGLQHHPEPRCSTWQGPVQVAVGF